MKAGWVKKHLGEVCESKLGKTLNASTDHGEIRPYLCAVNVKWDAFDLATIKKAPFDADEIKKYSVQKGDLLVCEGGETGRAAIWNKEEPIQYQNALHRIRFKEGTILPRFCLHYLRYLKLSGVLDKEYSHGATILHLVSKSLYSIPIEYPSLPEQQRIVDILDREFAKIDALKANAEKSLQAAKDLFQATLKKELGGKTKNLATLLSICQSIVDCPHSTPIKSPEKTNFPCIRTSELKAGRISWATMQYVSEDEYRKRITRLQPQEGDIVYGREGTIGDAVMLPTGYHFCLGQRTMLFRPNRSLINPKYLLYCVISPFVYNQAMSRNTGCGVAHVNVADVKQFLIPVPEQIDEQRRIVSYLDALNDKCSKLQENYQKTLTLCDDLKQSLLRKAFNGEL